MKSESIDTKQLSNLLLKVAGILLLILSIDNIHYYIWVYLQFKVKTFPLFISTVILPNILQLLFSLALFLIPDKITNRIIKNTYPIENNQNNLYQVIYSWILACIRLQRDYQCYEKNERIKYNIIEILMLFCYNYITSRFTGPVSLAGELCVRNPKIQ